MAHFHWAKSLLLIGILCPVVGFAEESDRVKERREQIRKRLQERRSFPRFGNRSQQTAKLPRNVENIPVKKVDGRTPLERLAPNALDGSISTEDLEQLIARELVSEGLDKAEQAITDDQFVRRVYLDIIGQLPAPADIEEYVASTSPTKKADLIDKLLGYPQYGENWAKYWRDVVVYRQTAGANRLVPFLEFENWLADQLNENEGWDDIATAMITATGLSSEHPEGILFGAHEADAAQMAGETSRIFMGIQIACAECHDHTTDTWKRDQFHELAAFFGKTDARVRRDLMQTTGRPVIEVGPSRRRREYRKPNLQDPSDAGELVQPVFLTGQPIPQNTDEAQRRTAIAQFLTSKRNPYFAKAFVNRVWAELMGFGFTNPVDDLGSHQPVAYPEVFDALSQSFAASNYDIKKLIKTIVLSRVYDRRFQELEDAYDQEILFTAIAPSRLTADQIFDAVDWVLGSIDTGGFGGPYRRRGPRNDYREAFGFDPSVNKEDLEGSIPQALLMMNNPSIHNRINAKRPGTLLNKLLRTQHSDKDIVEMLYLRVLARKPKAEEVSECLQYIKTSPSRSEGLEDVLWALLNSSEFLHNH